MASGKFEFHPEDFTIRLVSPFVDFTGTELYSDSAEYAANAATGIQYRVPVLASGNFPLGGGINSDSIFQVIEPWKVLPYDGTYRLDVQGTVITDGGITIPYDTQTVAFTVGEYVNGGTSDAIGIISADTAPGVGDGTLTIVGVTGVFLDGETLTDDAGGSATAAGSPADVVTNPFADINAGAVTVIVTAASSGTVAFSEEINNQSYLGQVWIDTERGTIGTAFPKGTPTDPINNFADANAIALLRKFNAYHLEGPLTLEVTDDITDTDWLGNSSVQSILTMVGNAADTNHFQNMTIAGSVTGYITAELCHFDNLSGFEGDAHDCLINNTLTLVSGSNVVGTDGTRLLNCKSGIPGTAKPVLDCNNYPQGISIRDWTGGFEIRNLTEGNEMTIDLLSGSILLDSSCTSATIVVRGVGDLIDNSGPGCTVITQGALLNITTIREDVWDAPTSAHTTTGTTGATLIAAGGVSDTVPPKNTPISRTSENRLILPMFASQAIMVQMVSDSDHYSPATGVSLTLSHSKSGSSWQSFVADYAEVGNGWYYITVPSSVTDTPGELGIQVQASGADTAYRFLEIRIEPDQKIAIVQGGSTTTEVTTDLQETLNNHWKDSFVRFTTGNLIGQVRLVTGYNGATKTLTVEALSLAPDSGDQFVLVNV